MITIQPSQNLSLTGSSVDNDDILERSLRRAAYLGGGYDLHQVRDTVAIVRISRACNDGIAVIVDGTSSLNEYIAHSSKAVSRFD